MAQIGAEEHLAWHHVARVRPVLDQSDRADGERCVLPRDPVDLLDHARRADILQEDDLDLVRVARTLIEVACEHREALDRGGITAQSHRVGAFDRHRRGADRTAGCPALPADQAGERGGDLGRASVAQGDDARRGGVRVDPTHDLAHAARTPLLDRLGLRAGHVDARPSSREELLDLLREMEALSDREIDQRAERFIRECLA